MQRLMHSSRQSHPAGRGEGLKCQSIAADYLALVLFSKSLFRAQSAAGLRFLMALKKPPDKVALVGRSVA
jgi:hypothetical protein